MWLFGDLNQGTNATHPEGDGYLAPQYPGPTLIVTEGDEVTIELVNLGIPDRVSIVVTGHEVTAQSVDCNPDPCGCLVTQTAGLSESVRYEFTANEPGTYIYHSLDRPNPGLHAEMGLLGVLIVRPNDGSRSAYGAGTQTDYDQEFLYLLTEVDPDIHLVMERGHYTHFTNSDRFAKIWFVNGRVFPNLLDTDFAPLYPNQPYASLALAHPGDQVLVRNVNAGHDSHPFHYHGENLRFVGRDGRMLSSNGATANLGRSDNTINSAPKQSIEALWTWTAKDLGWDIFGPVTACKDIDNNMEDDANPGMLCHDDNCIDGNGDGFDDVNYEYCADHGVDIPVTLPGVGEMTLGRWWSGSPFMGGGDNLSQGEGGHNPFGGYFFVWHSHAAKELTTFDIFPGGSLSSMVVLPPYIEIQ